jgi:NTP pyrophosphatase (non-canonical NTP hydrolase)
MAEDLTVTVSADALRKLLVAVSGPPHLIRELIVIQNLPGDLGDKDDPVSVLLNQYKEQVIQQKSAPSAHDDILRAATKLWGKEWHRVMVIEECAELIQALTHYQRERNSMDDVLAEVADVQIVCRQMAIDEGVKRVQHHVDRKMVRLSERINNNDPTKR